MGNVTGSSDHQHGLGMPYVDDLIVRSRSHVDALEHYRRVFERATQVGMHFKPSKCTFFSTPLEVLSHFVTLNGRISDPKKIHAITNFNDLIAVLTGPDVLLHYPDWSKPFHVHRCEQTRRRRCPHTGR